MNHFLFYINYFRTLPDAVFEAARIDGANSRQIFGKITLPLIKPILAYTLITSLIGGIQMFDVPQILTNGNGNPDRTSMTVIMYLNKHLYSKNYGMADKKENLIEEEVKETKKATRKKKSDEDSAKSTAKKPRKGKEGAEAELTEEEKAQAIQEKFMEKCRGILAIAKKKKNVLDYQEIMTYFQDTDFEADRMEKVFEILELKKVDVRMNDVPDEDEDIILDDEDEIDIEKIDLSVPEPDVNSSVLTRL